MEVIDCEKGKKILFYPTHREGRWGTTSSHRYALLSGQFKVVLGPHPAHICSVSCYTLSFSLRESLSGMANSG